MIVLVINVKKNKEAKMVDATLGEIVVAKVLLSEQYGVPVDKLTYVGPPMDASFMDESGDSDLLLFNVMEKTHEKYTSTVAIKRGNLNGKSHQKCQTKD